MCKTKEGTDLTGGIPFVNRQGHLLAEMYYVHGTIHLLKLEDRHTLSISYIPAQILQPKVRKALRNVKTVHTSGNEKASSVERWTAHKERACVTPFVVHYVINSGCNIPI